jgi:tetratricopeptide (TPR) repeat protein/predicted Ser/Thr protein kinase
VLRAEDQFLLQVAVQRGWLDERGRDAVLRQIAQSAGQSASLLSILEGHVSAEHLATLQRLSQAAGQDPRLAKGSAASASPGASFPGLDDEGDVAIDLRAAGEGEQAPQGIPEDLVELLAYAKGEVSVDLSPGGKLSQVAPEALALAPGQQAPTPSPNPPLSRPAAAQAPAAALDDLAQSQGDFSLDLSSDGSRPNPATLQAGAQAFQKSKLSAKDIAETDSGAHQVRATDDADSISTLKVDMSQSGLGQPVPGLNPDADATLKFPEGSAAEFQATVKLDMSVDAFPPAPNYPPQGVGPHTVYPPGSGAYALPPGSGSYPSPSYPMASSGVQAPPPAPATGSAGPPKPGGRVGPYRVVKELARGGMGVVYVAEHAELDRKVALKLLLPGGQNSHGVARFQVEARATARLNHPNIVRIFDVGEDPAGHYFAMDLVEGESLSDTIKTMGQLEPRRAAEITKKLAEALSYAHTHAILHRDMKPANVLMREDGEPVVTDFGLAKDVRERGLTVTGQVMGTPAYMPPEQAEGDSDQVDRRSDVYSIGATLFEMLTGEPPFKGQSPIHVLRQVLTDPPPRPSNLVPKLDRDLETICLKCLEKEPDQRYLSARALGEDLGLWLRDLPIRAQPPTLGRRISSWGRRNRALVGIFGTAACLLLGGGVWTLLQVTEARVRAEMEREAGLKQGRELASAELISAARSAVEERRGALAKAKPGIPGDDPRAQQAADQERVAQTLEFNNAALRWRAIAPDSKEAQAACFEAAMALGEATQAAKQWVLAAHAYQQALDLGVDSERAQKALKGVQEARTARARARAAEVKRLLSELGQGKLEREEVVFGLVNEADGQTVKLVVERLEEIVNELKGARRELLFESLPRGSEKGIDHAYLAEAIDALDARVLGTQLGPEHRDLLTKAREKVTLRANELRGRTEISKEGDTSGTSLGVQGRVGFGDVLTGRLGTAGGRQELVVARAAIEALGWIGVREGAVSAIGDYLGVESNGARAVPAGLALCRLGGKEAQEIVLASRKRFGVNSSYSRTLERALGTFEGQEVALDSETYEGYLERGEQLLATGQPKGAIVDLTKALELRPKATTALHVRATAHTALGDLRAAIRDYDRVLELQPDHGPSLNNRANLKKQRGDLKGAWEDFERGIKEHPRQVGFRVGHAQTLMALGRFQEALVDGDKAVEIAPQMAIAWHLRGVARMRCRDLEGALSDLTKSITVDRAGEIPANYLFRAEVYLSLKRPRKVLEDVERGLELKVQPADLWFFRGVAHLQLGDTKAAIQDMSETLKLDPSNAAAWANRGALRVNENDLEGALEDTTQALELSPRVPQPWLNRAEVRIRLEDYEGALEDVAGCLEKAQRPGAMPYFIRGDIYLRWKKPRKARAAFERFLELAPRHPKAEAARAHLQRLGG